ncbi:MAG: hypothetical protein ACTHNP_05840 [Solirubrobacterales bacterium]
MTPIRAATIAPCGADQRDDDGDCCLEQHLAESVEALVHRVEALVHRAVHLVEPGIHLGPQRLGFSAKFADVLVETVKSIVESLVGPLLPGRHHDHDHSVTFWL